MTPRPGVMNIARVVALALLAAAVLAMAPKAGAASTLVSKNLTIDVTGYIESQQAVDTTGDCRAGEAWIQTNRWDFETEQPRRVKLTSRKIGGQVFSSSTASRPAGTSVTKGSISGYRFTQTCAPYPPEVLPGPPACATNAGKARVGLTPMDRAANPEGFDPGNAVLLNIAIYRAGGGVQSLGCVGGEAPRIDCLCADIPMGDWPDWTITTSLGPAPGVILPLYTTDVALDSLNPKRRKSEVRRTYRISGSCKAGGMVTAAMTLRGDRIGREPPDVPPAADGDCSMTGAFTVGIRAAR